VKEQHRILAILAAAPAVTCAFALGACHGGEAADSPDTSDDDSPAAEPSTRFDTNAATWSVPTTGASEYGYFAVGNFSGQGTWSLVDIDGDDLPDLVSTAPAGNSIDVYGDAADSHWKVFHNTGGGFDTSPSTWSVPTTGASEYGYFAVGNFSGQGTWSLVDIDGDDLPDLVSTAPAGNSIDVYGSGADSHWKVFHNTGSGFDTSPSTWPVPTTGASEYGYFAVGNFSGQGTWSLVDIDGDDLPDLVSTAPAGNSIDVYGSGADAHWKVFHNTGSGFETSPTTWPVPTTGASEYGYFAVGNFSGQGTWSLVDIDGDDLPDLVSTAPAGNSIDVYGSGANSHWKIFHNTGSGFETSPTTWPVPTTGASEYGYFAVGNFSGQGTWSLVDIDGDDLPDLVSTAPAGNSIDVYGDAADSHWQIFHNTGSSFDTGAATWPVPATGASEYGYFAVGNFSGQGTWSLVDIDGDDLPDLVSTAPAGNSIDVYGSGADSHWQVFRGIP
jgi:hypothetical protein